GTPDHDAVGAGVVEHVLGLLRAADVAVGDHRDLHQRLDVGDGVVLGFAHVLVGAGAAVDGDGADAGFFGNAGDHGGVLVGAIPACAELERDRGVRHRLDHGFEDACDQWLVLHQRGAGHHVAHLLGRAAHVDVDDLGAVVGVVLGGFGHHRGVGAG